jgi:N-acyl amino acid synthase of PEP-CTERM/exosortase system
LGPREDRARGADGGRLTPPICGGSVPSGEAEVVPPRRYFDFRRLKSSDGLWDEVQQLRYAVYCLECKYLDAAKFPDERESDEYDPYSVHFAATNERKEMVATLRLVRDSRLGFPLEQHAGSLSPDYHRLPRERTAEISRLILARSYRRRANDGLYGQELGDPEKDAQAKAEATYRRSQYPLILFGLFKEMYLESVRMGLEYWVAAMETSLQRMLSKFGLGLQQVGEPMSYYGQVIPYYVSIRQLEQFVMESRPDVFQFFGPSRGREATS